MAITTTSVLTETLRPLYNAIAVRAFTEEGTFWQSATVQTIQMTDSNKGKSVVFDVWPTTTAATAALSETGDGTAVSQTMTQVEVSLTEHGAYEQFTGKLKLTDYGDPEQRAAWQMGVNANDTMDLLARDALDSQTGATWIDFSGSATAVANVVITDELSGSDVRKAYADLRAKKVRPVDGGYYLCYIHPHVFKDLQDETDAGSWTVKETYAGNLAGPLMFGEVGAYQGFRFVQTTVAKLATKAGAFTTTSGTSADVYTTYFVGAEGLGFGYAGDQIQVKMGEPMVGPGDAFGRFSTVGWYSLCGFKELKADAILKFYSSSSMAANGT
jgi:N4-gp56 family major capsid protein